MDKIRFQPKLSAFIALVFSLSPIVATAQIVPDDSLGRESSVVVPDNIKGIPSERLEGGAIRGGNLFHSFGEFNVGEGQGAYFANPALIENIFTRVTGTNVSNLLGTLGVLGNANLFLINPNGVIFGPNASLDLQGSFVVSSAESFVFNNFEFSASNPQAPPLLTINIPLGLRFQENPGPISARATTELKVGPGETLGLLGGEVRLDGTVIESPATQVELGSFAAPGVVELNEDLSFIFPEGAARGDIFLGNEAAINVRSGGGGSITIKAQNVDVVGGSKLRAGISEGLGSPEAQGGDIEINATGSINLADDSLIDNEIEENAVGNSGNVKIKTGSLSVNNGSIIGTTISGEGTAGSVTIEASDAVVLDGVKDLDILTGVTSGVEEGAEGNGGVITITTGSLEVKNGAEILSINWGKGNAGTVNINATETVVLDGGNSEFSTVVATSLEEGAEGNAGVITITTGSLEVKNGAGIDADTFGKGDAGTVNISATETVVLDGENSESYISSSVEEGAEGNAGGVTITTGSLEVKNGAQILASTFGKGDAGTVNINATETVVLDGENSEVFSGVGSSVEEGAEGNAGGVTITTGSLEVKNGAFISASTFAKGDAGTVNINATETVVLDGENSEIGTGVTSSVQPGAEGDAGGVTITTGSLEVKNGAQILASTFGKGDAGTVNINATETVVLDGENSEFLTGVTSSVEEGAEGDAGGVTITTGSLEVKNGAQILASTFGKGDAGTVNINATETVVLDGGDSEVFTGVGSSVEEGAEGNAGGVTITTGSLEVKNGVFISASTFAKGDAGTVNINATETVVLDGENSEFLTGVTSIVQEGAEGDAGGVTITTGSLEVKNGAFISASTLAKADAGTVNINATETVVLDGENSEFLTGVTSSVEEGAEGKAGGVTVTTGSLEVKNGAQLLAVTFGKGDAGTVNINATETVVLNGGDSEILTLVASVVAQGAEGNAGGVTITTESLEVKNGAGIAADTLGKGDAGTVNINATETVVLDGENSEFVTLVASSVQSGAEGDAGGVTITTESLEVKNGAGIAADTLGKGDAGTVNINATETVVLDGGESEVFTGVTSGVAQGAEGNAGGVTITTESLEVKNGAGIAADTLGKGDAGTVNINATETVVLDGGESEVFTGVTSGVAQGAEGNAGGVTITTGSLEVKNGAGIAASTFPESTGNGGDISIDATKVTITNSSEIAVSSEGQGNGGNIFLSAGDLFLDRGSKVSAITASGQGGNMTFNIANLFSLRNNSPISTTAGGTGNGGNIDISTEFLVAREDSDITANAFEGRGGNISITTQGIFSFPNSTIDASSQLGIDGVIEINTPDIDPSQGLIKFSENVVDPDQLIAQNPCLQGEESEYIITGRGGLSPSPAQTLNSDPLEVGLVEAATGIAATVTPPPPPTSTAQIVPAKGWKLNEKGEVILVSYDPTNTRVKQHRANPATCQPR